MVLTEVGEHASGECRAVHPGEFERVRRDLHHGGLHAGGDELGEPPLQFRRLGRGARARQRADHPGRPAYSLEDRGEQCHRRRLPVRAGDADGGQRGTGVSADRRCHPPERRANVVHDDLGDLIAEPLEQMVDDEHTSTGGDCRRGEVVAIRALPANAGERHARTRLSGVVGDDADGTVGVTDELDAAPDRRAPPPDRQLSKRAPSRRTVLASGRVGWGSYRQLVHDRRRQLGEHRCGGAAAETLAAARRRLVDRHEHRHFRLLCREEPDEAARSRRALPCHSGRCRWPAL